MSPRLAAVALMLACWTGFSTSPARAADTPYAIVLDGRPLSDDPKNAGGLSHDGVVFIDAILATKAFSGLLTFADAGHTVKISIAKSTATFTRGRLFATLDAGTMKLSAAPFIYNGDFYVPVTAFARLARASATIDRASATATLTTRGGSGH
jgi:hypothetical protein